MFDTSSIIEIKKSPKPLQKRIVFEMETFVNDGKLFYPKIVVDELKHESRTNRNAPDLPYRWAEQHASQATCHDVSIQEVKDILNQVPDVIDPQKKDKEEADPYVLALANKLKSMGLNISVVTDDRRDKQLKLSLQSACGIPDITSLDFKGFLRVIKIIEV